MALDAAIALASVDDIIAFLGENAYRSAFWVYRSGAGATATVQVENDWLILIHDAVTDANLDLSLAAYDTLAELVDYINASVAGWEAGRLYHSNALTVDLEETGQLPCLGSGNRQTLRILDRYLIAELINRASDLINRYCHRHFIYATYTHERYNGEGNKLFLENYPLEEVIEVNTSTIGAIRIKCTSAAIRNAYVIVTQGASINLYRDGTWDGPIDTTVVTGTAETLTKLVGVINGIGLGWSASIANSLYNPYPSAALFTQPNIQCLNADNYLEIPSDPIADYDVDLDNGTIEWTPSFSAGFRNVFVSYSAGYASGSAPYALMQFCIELVCYMYGKSKRADTGDLMSETLGDYSYEKFNMGDLIAVKALMPIELQNGLDLFKRRLL